MSKTVMAAALVLAGGFLSSGAALAAPVSNMGNAIERSSAVETVQSWRYRRDCVWVNGGWHYGRPGKYVVCRPHNPGRGWVWHSEGPRHGWYNQRRKEWHYRNW